MYCRLELIVTGSSVAVEVCSSLFSASVVTENDTQSIKNPFNPEYLFNETCSTFQQFTYAFILLLFQLSLFTC